MIERATDARFINAVVADPEIAASVRGPYRGALDLSGIVANHNNVALIGEDGFTIFYGRGNGIYDLHGAARPAGRGRWALNFARASLCWMFAHTNAVVITASIPAHNRGARNIAAALGFRLVRVLPSAWPAPDGGAAQPLYYYVLTRRDWGGGH